MNRSGSHEGRLRVLGAVAVGHLVLFGAATWLWLRFSGAGGTVPQALVCLLPVVAGVVLARTSTTDRNQYVARILACLGFLPILLLFWATSVDPETEMPARLVWPFAVGAALAHAAAFVGVVFWGGSYATMVPAAPGVAPVSADDLRARLLSLNGTDGAFEVTRGSPDVITFVLRTADAPTRGHQVLLRLSPSGHRVLVREKLTASLARPADAGEASMRGPADPFFDPTRPEASRVSGVTVQTSMIDPQQLAAVPLRLFGQTAELPDGHGADLNADAAVTLLCAVVTRSGWRWQPVFFSGGEN